MIPKLPHGLINPMSVGKGSFSSVFRVRQEHLDRLIAIKILNEKDVTLRGELLQEARTQAQMQSDCVPSIYDAIEWEGSVILLMQWLRGVSLESIMMRSGNDSERRALAIALANAVAKLHAEGYAHRDLKPANILLCPDLKPQLYLVDFGFTRKQEWGRKSTSGMVKGTPAYMAPELWGRGEVNEFRADLYALGKILKELQLGQAWDPLINPLLSENPELRPLSAECWWRECSQALPLDVYDWSARIRPLVSETLALSLRQSAKDLVLINRYDEAYWLLAESLQEDPDSSEALILIESIPRLMVIKRHRRQMFTRVSLALILLAVGLAFYAGRETQPRAFHSLTHNSKEREFISPRSEKSILSSNAFGLKSEQVHSRLTGFIQFENGNPCAQLLLDSQSISSNRLSQGWEIASGHHEILCLDRKGSQMDRQIIRIVPFQKKIIYLHSESKAEVL